VVTSNDIARLAGVSRATVSRVLNGSEHTSAEARRRVGEAIAQTGYVPDTAARSLVGQRSHTIALSLFSADATHMLSYFARASNFFYHDLLGSIEAEASESGYDIWLMPRRHDSAASFMSALRARRIIGVIMMGPDLCDERIPALAEAGMPTVCVDSRVQGQFMTYVETDKISGARQMTSHLLDLGHRCIAFMAGPSDSINSGLRELGHQHAFIQRGLSCDMSLVRHVGYEIEDGYAGATALLSERSDFTAIVAVSDMVAIGVLRALYDRGLRVPEDMSVTGFDDNILAGYTIPPLTTVRQDTQILGKGIVARLRSVIDGEGEPLPLIVPTGLVVRQSTGAPKLIT
jgi:LacI family transcriptional regulator